MFTFNGYMHQGHSICSRKPPSKFVIGAFFRLVMLFAVFGHFFFVYLNYFENCWEMFTFDIFAHQGLSICSRKPPSKFDIGSLLRLFLNFKTVLNIDLGRIPGFHVKIGRFGHFFFVYLNYFENCWEMFTFNGYKHQGHSIAVENHPQRLSICSRKPPSKFEIGSLLRLVMLYKETKKKKFQKSINNSKNTYLFENSTIHR
ncbi:hypothetical protein AGLY_017533 [Aphis glycines]|uniref:Uncharacterized protein n=1 Tax=Aphis glycines TaxID=307491 RepID=A0A6G0SUT0_APHGL|nr:hypothetical protein AGLY_017533 [Aphis glycines]